MIQYILNLFAAHAAIITCIKTVVEYKPYDIALLRKFVQNIKKRLILNNKSRNMLLQTQRQMTVECNANKTRNVAKYSTKFI